MLVISPAFFLLFSQSYFILYQRQKSSCMLSSAHVFNLIESKILSFGKEITLYPHSPDFQRPSRSLLKTIRENEKMLVTSIFSFSYNVIEHMKKNLYHLSYTGIIVCEFFQFRQDQNFAFW